MTFTHAVSTDNYGPAKWIVDASAANGTHTTIAAAITSASSGDTIVIRQGTYTENLTLKAGVNLTGWPSDGETNEFPVSLATYNVKIIGKMSMSAAGFVCISNIFLQTNSDNILSVTGTAATYVLCKNCYINASNNTAIVASSTIGEVGFENCSGNLGTTGIAYFSCSGGSNFAINGGMWGNSGSSLTASTNSGGILTLKNCEFDSFISSSGTTASVSCFNTFFNAGALNTAVITHNSTGSNSVIWDCYVTSGTASTISIGAGATLELTHSNIKSSNANTLTGAGTLNYAFISFPGSSSGHNVTTENALATLI